MAQAAELMGAELAVTGGESIRNFVRCESVAADLRATEVDVIARRFEERPGSATVVLVTDHDALGYLAERYDYRRGGRCYPRWIHAG